MSHRIMREFNDIFGVFLAKNFNECLDEGFFLHESKCAEILLVYKNVRKRIKITELSIFCLKYQNYIKMYATPNQ